MFYAYCTWFFSTYHDRMKFWCNNDFLSSFLDLDSGNAIHEMIHPKNGLSSLFSNDGSCFLHILCWKICWVYSEWNIFKQLIDEQVSSHPLGDLSIAERSCHWNIRQSGRCVKKLPSKRVSPSWWKDTYRLIVWTRRLDPWKPAGNGVFNHASPKFSLEDSIRLWCVIHMTWNIFIEVCPSFNEFPAAIFESSFFSYNFGLWIQNVWKRVWKKNICIIQFARWLCWPWLPLS